MLIRHPVICFSAFLLCQALHIKLFLQRPQDICGGGKSCSGKLQLRQDLDGGFGWPDVHKLHFLQAKCVPSQGLPSLKRQFPLLMLLLWEQPPVQRQSNEPTASSICSFLLERKGDKGLTRCVLVGGWTDMLHFILSTRVLDCELIPRKY